MSFAAAFRRPALRSVALAASMPASASAPAASCVCSARTASSAALASTCVAGPSSSRLQDMSSGDDDTGGDHGAVCSEERGLSRRHAFDAAAVASRPASLIAAEHDSQPQAPTIPRSRKMLSVADYVLALSARIQEDLTDETSAAKVPDLVQRVLMLMRIHALKSFGHGRHHLSTPTLLPRRRRLQLLQRSRTFNALQMRSAAQYARDHKAVQDLVLQFASHLTHIDDGRARRAASSLLRHVSARSTPWLDFLQADVQTTLDQRWKGQTKGKGKGKAREIGDANTFDDAARSRDGPLLRFAQWKRRRRRRLRMLRLSPGQTYEGHFVEHLCRTILGIDESNPRLDHERLNYTLSLHNRSLGGTSRWLDIPLMRQCLAYMRVAGARRQRQHLHSNTHSHIEPSVLAIALLTAVRHRNIKLSSELTQELDLLLETAPNCNRGRSAFNSASLPQPSAQNAIEQRPISDLLQSPASASAEHPRKPNDTTSNPDTLMLNLEAGLFSYIDEFARKQTEQTGPARMTDAQQARPQQVAKEIFHRLLESCARSRPLPSSVSNQGEPALQTTDVTRNPNLPLRTAIQGMETLARDPSIPPEEVFSYFCFDRYGNDVSESDRAYRVPLNLKWHGAAYGYAMRGFAMRADFEASDLLFVVFLRRQAAQTVAKRRLRLDALMLSFRWTAETLRVQHLARMNADALSRTYEARSALVTMLNFLNVRPRDFAELEQPNYLTAKLKRRLATSVAQPTAKLMTNIVFSLARRWGARRAAFVTWLALERRWPSIARDVDHLKSLLLTARALQNEPLKRKTVAQQRTLYIAGNPAMIARRIFRQWLFAQHPELHPLSANPPRPPRWLPRGAHEINMLHRGHMFRKAGPSESDDDVTPPPAPLNFSAELFHAYAHLLVSMIESDARKRTGYQPRMFSHSTSPGAYRIRRGTTLTTAWASRTELVLVLAWMRRLKIQPSHQTLCLIGDQLRRYYHWHRLEWPAGRRFDKNASHGRGKPRRYEGMGPLNEWLSEWMEDRWPTALEVSLYAKYRKETRGSDPETIWDI